MEKVIEWLLGSKSSDQLIRFGRIVLVLFAIAGTVATWGGGNLGRLLFLAMFVLGMAVTIWGASLAMKSPNGGMALLGRVLAGAMLIGVACLFLATVSFLLMGQPAAVGRALGMTAAPPTSEEMVRSLASDSIEVRVLALTRITGAEPASQSEADGMVRALESFINRRAALGPQGSTRSPTPKDVQSALAAISGLLAQAHKRAYAVRPPEFAEVSLAGADLTRAYLRGARFSGAVLDEAVLDDADLSDATLTDVHFVGASARNVLMRAARVLHTCAEDATFDGADLAGAEFTGSDFNGASFRRAGLARSTFANSRLTNAIFDAADLSGANMSGALELLPAQLKRARSTQGTQVPEPLYVKSRLTLCKVA